MRLLVITLLLAACGSTAESGTLGLPTPLPSRSASAPPSRTPPLTPPPPSASPSTTPTPPLTPSATPPPTPTRTQLPTPTTPPTATPPPTPDLVRPFVVSASATQLTLTVIFSEPMNSQLACGAIGPPSGPLGTIDNQRSGEAASPYHSADRALDETLQSATRATIGADCASITFLYTLAAPAGTFTITVSSVQDRAGNTIDTTRNAAQVTIRDEGPPVATRADAFGDNIYVTFTEPMLQIGEGSGVTMAGNYQLDGAAAPITQISCNDAGCRGVRLLLRAGTIVPGRTYSLRIANVVDRSGRAITPDPTTISLVGRPL
jgi:hypothetical protein